MNQTQPFSLNAPGALRLAFVIGSFLTVFALTPTHGAAQTVTWNWQAHGQTVGVSCSQNGGILKGSVTYPDDNNWSQSVNYGLDPCGNLIVAAPSNWSTTNAPNGPTFDVIIGNQGGAPANLDINVQLRSLTILPVGQLNMQPGTTISATNFDFQGDADITGSGTITNLGLFRKSSGTNLSMIAAAVTNRNGNIEVDCGQLALNGSPYYQAGGTLTIFLGGANPGQFGQLSTGAATLNGPLRVVLTNGFVPPTGVQFQILATSSLHGAFSSTNLPAGMSLSYSNNSVYVFVPGAVVTPLRLLTPHASAGSFTFSFQTVSQQSYTVQQNTNLGSTNWTTFSNLIGNGSLFQFSTPISNNVPTRFFRVREP